MIMFILAITFRNEITKMYNSEIAVNYLEINQENLYGYIYKKTTVTIGIEYI